MAEITHSSCFFHLLVSGVGKKRLANMRISKEIDNGGRWTLSFFWFKQVNYIQLVASIGRQIKRKTLAEFSTVLHSW